MIRLLFALLAVVTLAATSVAPEIPTTNWGDILKVPLDKVAEVDKGLIEWVTWIKETNPLGDEEDGLDSLTITRDNPTGGHIYYVIVERYDTLAGLKNHQNLFYRDSEGAHAGTFTKLYFIQAYRVSVSEQRKTVFSIVS